MYSSRPGLLIGYHGCDEAIRDAIVTDKAMLRVSQNKYDWLGAGYYFWEDNYARALDFAIHPPGKKQIKKPAVLGAIIELGNCLDLMNMDYILMIKDSFSNLSASLTTSNKSLPINRNANSSNDILLRELDCAVIENLHLQRASKNKKAFDSVRGLFVEGQPVYEGAGFHDKNHIQLCIRNPNCIKGFFKPREEIHWLG
jgi:hypothetical protein